MKKRDISVQFSCSVVSDSLRPHESQHTRPPCPSPTPGAYSNSCPSSRWCHPAISSSVIPFSFCSQSLPASGSFPMSLQSFKVLAQRSINFKGRNQLGDPADTMLIKEAQWAASTMEQQHNVLWGGHNTTCGSTPTKTYDLNLPWENIRQT